MEEQTTQVAVTKTQAAIQSITNLGSVKKELDSAIIAHTAAVAKLKERPKSTETKESALRGKEKIKSELEALKEKRLVETRKLDALVSVFTTEEKKLDALAGELQTYANECVEIELANERKRQAEAIAEQNKKNEIVDYKNKVRDYIVSEIDRVKKEYVKQITAAMDAHKVEFGNADLVEKLKAAERGKIKNVAPAFEFKLNPDYDKVAGYREQFKEMTEQLKQFENDMGQMLQDAIIGVPNFVKQLKENPEDAKQTIEATEVLMVAEVAAQTEEIVSDNKLNDSIQMVDDVVPEIVIDAKKKYHYNLDKKIGLASLFKWYLTTDEFVNMPLEKVEDLTVKRMLNAAVKEYGKDEKLELNGISFGFTNIAK